MESTQFDLKAAIAKAKQESIEAERQHDESVKAYQDDIIKKDAPLFMEMLLKNISRELFDGLRASLAYAGINEDSTSVKACFKWEGVDFELRHYCNSFDNDYKKKFYLLGYLNGSFVDSVQLGSEFEENFLVLAIDKIAYLANRNSKKSEPTRAEQRAKQIEKFSLTATFASDDTFGLTMREYYIGQAISGLSANPQVLRLLGDDDISIAEFPEFFSPTIAEWSIQIADAAIARLADEALSRADK